MTYFADLTPYCFIRSAAKGNELNVGWLDHEHSFQCGPVPVEVLPIIFALCKAPVHPTRGAHICPLCPEYKPDNIAIRGQSQLRLGSAEIRVAGRSGIEYACPDLIYHYIKDHEYQPPQEFVDAVLALGKPASR